MQPGARRSVTTAYPERAVYCAAGEIEIGSAVLGAGQMAVLNGRDAADVAANQPSTVMVLGGEPIGERFLLWNFVSSSRERLEQAREDWKAGRVKLPDADHRSEEHTSEIQSLMRLSYAVFCLQKKKKNT